MRYPTSSNPTPLSQPTIDLPGATTTPGGSNPNHDVAFWLKDDFDSQLPWKNVALEMSFFLLTGCRFADRITMQDVALHESAQKNILVAPGDPGGAYRCLALLARVSNAGNVANFPLGATKLTVITELKDMLCFTELLCRVSPHRIIRPSEYPHRTERTQ